MSRERIVRPPEPFLPRNAHTVAVTLPEDVIVQVMAFATRIEYANRKRKRRNVQGLTAKGRDSLAMRMMGYAGEAALARYLGLDPVRLADEWRSRPDVLCFDVMTTDKAHGALIVTPRDRLDMMKVLVIDRAPVFHICGWYRAGDARLEAERAHSEWWRTERERGGAWYVPQTFLRPLWDEEAQRALARYYRQWDGLKYVNLEHVWEGPPVHSEMGPVAVDEPRTSPFWEDYMRARMAVGPGPVFDPDTGKVLDWREVLRRAGAAPEGGTPEENP